MSLLNEKLKELWVSRLADFKASGESVKAWCERHQIPKDQLYYWRQKLAKVEQPAALPQWLSLNLVDPAPLESTPDKAADPILVNVCLARIEVRPGFDPAFVAEVVKALKSVC